MSTPRNEGPDTPPWLAIADEMHRVRLGLADPVLYQGMATRLREAARWLEERAQ